MTLLRLWTSTHSTISWVHAARRSSPSTRRTPEYVRFDQVPIVEPIQPLILADGERLPRSLRYYAYGVVRAQLEIPFECDWDALVPQASRWMNIAPVEPLARELVRKHLAQLGGVLVKPSPDWLEQDYLVIDLQGIRDRAGRAPTAAELLSDHAGCLVQLIRGETIPLAPRAAEEALQASASYYASDLVVVGSSAALVYDRPEDAAATIQILEYPQTQLLEFRYYNLMTRVLAEVYAALDRKRNILLSRQSLTRDTIRLDVMELPERVDNAIKFLSDIFYTRVYRMAAARMSVPDYRALVEQKLRTAGELYDVMVNQFNEARTFVIEVLIALLCLLDVILMLRDR
jgi:hypothetical protein